jgi:hypothetical protein
MDEERDFPRDPASLLPFVCDLMPANPDAVQIANSKRYIGEKATDAVRLSYFGMTFDGKRHTILNGSSSFIGGVLGLAANQWCAIGAWTASAKSAHSKLKLGSLPLLQRCR